MHSYINITLNEFKFSPKKIQKWNILNINIIKIIQKKYLIIKNKYLILKKKKIFNKILYAFQPK